MWANLISNERKAWWTRFSTANTQNAYWTVSSGCLAPFFIRARCEVEKNIIQNSYNNSAVLWMFPYICEGCWAHSLIIHSVALSTIEGLVESELVQLESGDGFWNRGFSLPACLNHQIQYSQCVNCFVPMSEHTISLKNAKRTSSRAATTKNSIWINAFLFHLNYFNFCGSCQQSTGVFYHTFINYYVGLSVFNFASHAVAGLQVSLIQPLLLLFGQQ